MKLKSVIGLVLLVTGSANAVTLPPFVSEHMVLQYGVAAPIWGKAEPGEKVTVSFAGKSATATADARGEWMAKLGPIEMGKDGVMTITSDRGATIEIKDVVAGDVWICSGQSNMQMVVKSCNNAEKEIASADDAGIRCFRMPLVTATQPTRALKGGAWRVCSPGTVGEFTAVGYFFARQLRADLKVPIGLIDNSWGGMPAESFTSREMLESDPDFKPLLNRKAGAMKISKEARDQAATAAREYDAKWLHKDEGNQGEKDGWAKIDLDESDWKAIELPKHIEDAGLKIDGAVWFRRTVELPGELAGKEVTLSLGNIDDFDTTYVNGKQVGKTGGPWAVFVSREYAVPAELTKDGKLTIAVRVFDVSGPGGFNGPAVSMNLALKGSKVQNPMSIAGPWKYKVEKSFEQQDNAPPRPAEPTKPDAPGLASNIYNSMVHPLIPLGIKGAIWYQGESNADRAEQYRKLFPAMIKDWRDHWGQGDFPFYFVQLANFANFKPRPDYPWDSKWAELREAQTLTLKASKNTGMAVIIDIGDTKDIHPKNKQDVGKRLALIAEAKTYKKDGVEYLGPMYASQKVDGTAIRVKFANAKGLESRDGSPKGFAIAGDDKKFHRAEAKIDGDEVIVSSEDVPRPVAVRYAWEDDPQVNTFNAAGLPMCPFRTDDWKMATAGAK